VPFGFRWNLDRGTAPAARPRPGRGPIWPGRRCRRRRQSAVRVVIAVPRRCTPTSPAGRRLASAPAALGTRPLVVFSTLLEAGDAAPARADLAVLLLPSTQAPLLGLGRQRQAQPRLGAWQPGPRPQLGPRRRRLLRRFPGGRARPPRPRRQQLGAGRYVLDPGVRPGPFGPGRHRREVSDLPDRPLAGRRRRPASTPASTPIECASSYASKGSAPRP